MKKEEAERLIVSELRKIFAKNPPHPGEGGMVAYNKLKDDRPDLFDFRHSGDQWQVVSGWIKKHRLM